MTGEVEGACTGDAAGADGEVVLDDGELVDAAEAVDLLEVVAEPGMVLAPMAPNSPTPMTALIAAPVVRRFNRRMAASRARTLACVVSLVSMAVSLDAASKSALRESWELAVNVKYCNARHRTLVTAFSIDFGCVPPP